MIFADDGYYDSSGWYAGGSYTSRSLDANGITPAENRFLSLTPLFFFASSLFPGVYCRRRRSVREVSVATFSGTRMVAFSGEELDQFDLDVLLVCLGQASERFALSSTLVRLRFGRLLQGMKLRADKTGRERVVAAIRRLEQARIEIFDSRYRLSLQLVSKLLFDQGSDSCLMELHPVVLEAFRGIPGLKMLLQERFSLGRSSLAKWLHAVTWAAGGKFYMDLGSMRSLSGCGEMDMPCFQDRLDKAVALLSEQGLLKHVEMLGRDGFVLAGTREDRPRRKCLLIR